MSNSFKMLRIMIFTCNRRTSATWLSKYSICFCIIMLFTGIDAKSHNTENNFDHHGSTKPHAAIILPSYTSSHIISSY
ncbi:hypothetical protein BJ165DRAFT_1482708 [Panaeolus papilionaceus]|nr:hypothetical protein BJ165DRAFT_1482708 [Panaeolus papilionaceus]